MGMTMTQKILAAHAGLEAVKPGQLISARLDQVLEELLRESAGGQLGSELAARARLTQLLVWLNRRHRPAAEGPEQDLMERLTGYIQDHLCGPLSLDALSRRFFVSKYHLSRLFRQRMGTSLYRYIIQRRLILAKQLLMKPLPATEAYRQSGFGDYANFYRAFRAEYGLSPRQFQQEWRRAEERKNFD